MDHFLYRFSTFSEKMKKIYRLEVWIFCKVHHRIQFLLALRLSVRRFHMSLERDRRNGHLRRTWGRWPPEKVTQRPKAWVLFKLNQIAVKNNKNIHNSQVCWNWCHSKKSFFETIHTLCTLIYSLVKSETSQRNIKLSLVRKIQDNFKMARTESHSK